MEYYTTLSVQHLGLRLTSLYVFNCSLKSAFENKQTLFLMPCNFEGLLEEGAGR